VEELFAMKAPPTEATFGIDKSVKFPRMLRAPEILVRTGKPLISVRMVLFSIWTPPPPIVSNLSKEMLPTDGLPLIASPVTVVKLGAEIDSIELKRKLKVPSTLDRAGIEMDVALRKVKSPVELSSRGSSTVNP